MIVNLKENKIKLKKELNEIDTFVFNFLDILKKFTDYVIVSGYVSILFGRSRATEDIDILIPKMPKNIFKELSNILITKEYWFLNSDDLESLYDLLDTNHSIRIAKLNQIIPNIELKFVKNLIDSETLSKKIKIIIEEKDNIKNKCDKDIFISNLELQIVYKKNILKSNKDLEDAIFLEELFKDKLDKSLIAKYENLIKKHYN